MGIQERTIRGALAYYTAGNTNRLIDAWGENVVKYELQPNHIQPVGSTGTDPAGWTTTMVEAGAGTSEVAGASTAGYLAVITTDNAENDGVSMQLGTAAFELTSGQDLYFGVEFAIDDVTQTDFFVGLAVTDTAILAGVTDRIGFEKLDGSADVGFLIEKDSTETKASSLLTMANNTLAFLEFYWDGAALSHYVNGIQQTAVVLTNLPDDVALRPTIEFLTGEAAAKNLSIRQLRVIQVGR